MSELEEAQWAAQVLAKHQFKNIGVWTVRVTTVTSYPYGVSIKDSLIQGTINEIRDRSYINIYADEHHSVKYDVEEAVAIARGLEVADENH